MISTIPRNGAILSLKEMRDSHSKTLSFYVARTATAKEYTGGHRLYGLVQGDLYWTFDMAAMGQELQNHLAAQLKRVIV